MENAAFNGSTEKEGVELSDVKVNEPVSRAHACQPDLCRSLHAKYLEDKTKMAANPWDRLKTLFLVGIIAMLTLWLLLYVVCSRMGLV